MNVWWRSMVYSIVGVFLMDGAVRLRNLDSRSEILGTAVGT